MAVSNSAVGPGVAPTHPVLVGYLLWLLGFFGLHRFYYGRPISGLIYALTLGLLLVGWIVDLFLIPQMAESAERRYPAGRFDYTLAWVLLLFLGVLGVHRFYLGKVISGVVYLLTAGLFGIGVLYDVATLNTQVAERNREVM